MKNALVASVEYGNDIKSASKDDKWWWWVVWFDCCNCCNRNCSNSDRRQLLHLTLLTQRIKWYFDIWYFDILILWLLLHLTLLTQRIKWYFDILIFWYFDIVTIVAIDIVDTEDQMIFHQNWSTGKFFGYLRGGVECFIGFNDSGKSWKLIKKFPHKKMTGVSLLESFYIFKEKTFTCFHGPNSTGCQDYVVVVVVVVVVLVVASVVVSKP